MAKGKKRLRPSLEPQMVTKHVWYYERPGSIEVVIEVVGPNGHSVAPTQQVRIPWSKIMVSAARCGRTVPKLSVREAKE